MREIAGPGIRVGSGPRFSAGVRQGLLVALIEAPGIHQPSSTATVRGKEGE